MQYNGTIYGKIRGKYTPLQETAQGIETLKQKLENAEKALRDIKALTEDCQWTIAGEIAIAALNENDKLTNK